MILGTYVFALFVNVTNLKPDIFFGQWPGRILDDIFETLWLFSKVHLQNGRRRLPLSFDRTSVAVCILYQDGSRSHLLSRSLAAYA